MSAKFVPQYKITTTIVKNLMRIEAAKVEIAVLPPEPLIVVKQQRTVKFLTAYYSTMMGGRQQGWNTKKKSSKRNENAQESEQDTDELVVGTSSRSF